MNKQLGLDIDIVEDAPPTDSEIYETAEEADFSERFEHLLTLIPDRLLEWTAKTGHVTAAIDKLITQQEMSLSGAAKALDVSASALRSIMVRHGFYKAVSYTPEEDKYLVDSVIHSYEQGKSTLRSIHDLGITKHRYYMILDEHGLDRRQTAIERWLNFFTEAVIDLAHASVNDQFPYVPNIYRTEEIAGDLTKKSKEQENPFYSQDPLEDAVEENSTVENEEVPLKLQTEIDDNGNTVVNIVAKSREDLQKVFVKIRTEG